MSIRSVLVSAVLVSSGLLPTGMGSGGCAGSTPRLLSPDDEFLDPSPRTVLGSTVGTVDGSAHAVVLAAHAGPVVVREPGVTFASWNIHAGKDASLDVLAERLRALDADVIALQEVEVGTRRAGGKDQGLEIAKRLGMKRVFAASLSRDGGLYGVALLTRLPLQSVKRVELPGSLGLEPRVVIDAELDARVFDDDERPLRVLATHADVLPWASLRHAEALSNHLGDAAGERVVLLGDLNITPGNTGVRGLVAKGLHDALAALDPRPTGPWPMRARIDYVFVGKALAQSVRRGSVVVTDGSDHYPVWIRLARL